jgi:hypothetical protein
MGSLLIIESNGTGPFYNGQTTSFTITGLPTHMSFDLLVYGTVTDNSAGNTYHNYPDDSITMTGPLFPAQTCEVPSPDFVIDGMVADLNGLTSAQFNLNGTLDSGDSWSITSATVRAFLGSPSIPDGSVVIGGESAIPVHFSSAKFDERATGYSIVPITVSGVDTALVQPLSSVVTLDAAGDGTLFVKGTKVGTSPITVTDPLGDYCTASIGVTAPQVSYSVPIETQGATYGPDDTIPGFWFTCGPSLTDVPVNYNTEGSTLPASLMGAIAGGTVTIPASPTGGSFFVAMEASDDGKIAPSRWALVTLVVPGEDPGGSAKIRVDNTDVPTVKINSATSGALIKVDPEGVDGKLADIQLIIPDADQNIVTTTLSWSPELVIWLTDHVGAPGTDLGSMAGGGSSYTWQGKGPAEVYAQAMGGSSNWNSTNVTLTVHVSKPATQAFAEATRDATNIASGTANGLVISPGGPLQAPTKVLVGQLMGFTATWVGPGAPTLQTNGTVQWSIDGRIASAFEASRDSGHINTTVSTSGPYLNLDGSLNSTSFFWYDGSFDGRAATVTANLSSPNASGSARAFFAVYRPDAVVNVHAGDYSFNGDQLTAKTQFTNNSGTYTLAMGNPDAGIPGIRFDAYANVPQPFAHGDYEWIQVGLKYDGSTTGLFGSWQYQHGDGLDTEYPYGNSGRGTDPSVDTLTGFSGVSHAIDGPSISGTGSQGFYILQVTMTLMFKPSGGGDWVPLVDVPWTWFATYNGTKFSYLTKYPTQGASTNIYPAWSSYFAVGHNS